MFLFRKIYASAAVFLLAAALCSCSQQNETSVNDDSIAEFSPITEIQEGRKNIYLIVKDLDDEYWKVLSKGAAVSGNELEVNVYMSGSEDEIEIEQQVRLVDKAISLNADAIIIAPDDAVRLSDCVSSIHAQGIPVVLADTMVNCQDYDVCFMTDNMLAGREAAKTLIDDMKKNGVPENNEANVVILTGAVTVPSLNERIAGFCGYWADYAPADWKILDDVCKSDDYNDAVIDIKDIFDRHDNINGVFAANYFTAEGFADYIRNSGRKDISLVNFDFPDKISELMKDESFSVSSVLQKNYEMGYKAVEACVNLCDGEVPEPKFVDTGILIIDHETRNTPQVQDILSHY